MSAMLHCKHSVVCCSVHDVGATSFPDPARLRGAFFYYSENYVLDLPLHMQVPSQNDKLGLEVRCQRFSVWFKIKEMA